MVLDVNVTVSSDCDIRFSLGAIKAGITDFSLYGTVRVVLKPLMDEFPIVGGSQVEK